MTQTGGKRQIFSHTKLFGIKSTICITSCSQKVSSDLASNKQAGYFAERNQEPLSKSLFDFKDKTIKVLLNGGADINAIATYGGQPPKLTPLNDAERVGNKIAAKILIKKRRKA